MNNQNTNSPQSLKQQSLLNRGLNLILTPFVIIAMIIYEPAKYLYTEAYTAGVLGRAFQFMSAVASVFAAATYGPDVTKNGFSFAALAVFAAIAAVLFFYVLPGIYVAVRPTLRKSRELWSKMRAECRKREAETFNRRMNIILFFATVVLVWSLFTATTHPFVLGAASFIGLVLVMSRNQHTVFAAASLYLLDQFARTGITNFVQSLIKGESGNYAAIGICALLGALYIMLVYPLIMLGVVRYLRFLPEWIGRKIKRLFNATYTDDDGNHTGARNVFAQIMLALLSLTAGGITYGVASAQGLGSVAIIGAILNAVLVYLLPGHLFVSTGNVLYGAFISLATGMAANNYAVGHHWGTDALDITPVLITVMAAAATFLIGYPLVFVAARTVITKFGLAQYGEKMLAACRRAQQAFADLHKSVYAADKAGFNLLLLHVVNFYMAYHVAVIGTGFMTATFGQLSQALTIPFGIALGIASYLAGGTIFNRYGNRALFGILLAHAVYAFASGHLATPAQTTGIAGLSLLQFATATLWAFTLVIPVVVRLAQVILGFAAGLHEPLVKLHAEVLHRLSNIKELIVKAQDITYGDQRMYMPPAQYERMFLHIVNILSVPATAYASRLLCAYFGLGWTTWLIVSFTALLSYMLVARVLLALRNNLLGLATGVVAALLTASRLSHITALGSADETLRYVVLLVGLVAGFIAGWQVLYPLGYCLIRQGLARVAQTLEPKLVGAYELIWHTVTNLWSTFKALWKRIRAAWSNVWGQVKARARALWNRLANIWAEVKQSWTARWAEIRGKSRHTPPDGTN
jgi:hypothetical protein